MAAKQTKKPDTGTEALSVFALMQNTAKGIGLRHIDLKEKTAADYISTGILSLDLIMGGGYIGGRVVQYYGPAHTGKSSVAFGSAVCLISNGVPTAFMDHEATADKTYIDRLANARNIGVSLDNSPMQYFKPPDGETTYELIYDLCKKLPDKDDGTPQACLIIDSIAMMPTRGEMEDWDENHRMAQHAAMHSQWWTRIKTLISAKNVAIIVVNQIRANPSPYAPPVVRPGGNALEFATDNLIRLARGKQVRIGADTYQQIIFKTEKNKQAAANREATVFMRLGYGIDPASDVLEFLRLTGLLHKGKVEADAEAAAAKPKKAKAADTEEGTKKKSGPPSIVGLDAMLGPDYPVKVDQSFASAAALEKTIRDQMAAGTREIYAACEALLANGGAKKLYNSFLSTEVVEEKKPNKKGK